MEIIKNPNYDFIGKAKYFVALSLFFILGGVAVMGCAGSATASSSPAARS